MKLRVSGERDSKAADMLANKVSPPELGSSTACNMVPLGGISNHVASVCQVEVPLFMPLPFSFAILCTISFSVAGAKSKGTGSPKIDAAAICCSSSRFWFLKNKTPCLCHAATHQFHRSNWTRKINIFHGTNKTVCRDDFHFLFSLYGLFNRIACEYNSVHYSSFTVVRCCIVLDTPVVPDCYISFFPGEPELNFRP